MHRMNAGLPGQLLLLLALLAMTLPACGARTRGGGGGGGDDDDDSADPADDDDLFNPDDDDTVDDDDVVTDDDDVVTDDDDVVTDDDDTFTDDDDTFTDDDDTFMDDDDTFTDDDDTFVDDDDTFVDDDDATTSGQCQPFTWLSCGSPSDSSTTTSSNATNAVDTYSCPASSLTGPEMAYWFTAETTGLHTIVLSGMSADLDLVILEGYDCTTTATCADYAGSSSAETAQWTASAGDDFVIVVDGWSGASGAYDIELTCPDTGDDDDATMGDDDDFTSDDDDASTGCDSESEPNGSASQAEGPLYGPSAAFCGSISSTGDSDWYEIVVTSSLTSLTMRTDQAGSCTAAGSVDTELHFYDSTSTLLESDDDGSANYCSLLVRNNVSPGTYYVAVEHYSNSGTGTYRLDIEF